MLLLVADKGINGTVVNCICHSINKGSREKNYVYSPFNLWFDRASVILYFSKPRVLDETDPELEEEGGTTWSQ